MPTSPIPPTDTRAFFRPVAAELVALLRGLPVDAFHRPTIAGRWQVRDVVAHLVDTTLRRVSFHRDRLVPPAPPRPLASHDDLLAFINGLNAEWVAAASRISPRLLTTLYAAAAGELADFVEAWPLDSPALFPVSWAGEDGDSGWLDIGREFTEQWHHQMQIRDAVGAGPLPDPAWLKAFLLIAVRGLPHAYREAPADPGTAIVIAIDGAAGGVFTLRRDEHRWRILAGEDGTPHARAILSDDTAWRLLFNALPLDGADARVRSEGRRDLIRPLLRARSVVV